MATITSHYPRAALGGLLSKGLGPEQLLRRAGISDELLNTEGTRVHVDQMTRVVQAVWRELDDEFMGFTSRRCKPGSFAMMSQLVSRCDTVDAFYQQGTKFYQLMSDDIEMQYRQLPDSRELVISMAQPELDPEHFMQEFWLVIWHRFCSWIIGQRIALKSIHFTYAEPAQSAEFKHQFSCPCYFNAEETKFCFSDSYAQLKPNRTQRELAQFLKHAPADMLTIPGDDNSFGSKVKRQLLDELERNSRLSDQVELAAKFNLSESTFRRQLKAEGSSYQKIKTTIRCDLAIEKLHVQDMAVDDVAALLGFSEPRSFCRAFKQWTGVTPSAYRANG